MRYPLPHLLGAGALALGAAGMASADQQILDDLIVDGSICVGQDCVNGESFGFDTLRLKENNLRIKAQDTSSTASFPSNDWQITFNESSNGGANKFSIDDIDGGRIPFTIEAGAPSHSLYVEDGGRLGFGTNTPVVDLHVKSGNTPTLRLEQDGSSGFAAQTWDLAGNEANLFIRDASNGSDLPFRIYPNPGTNALVIEGTTGDIGMGTNTPDADLEISTSETFTFLRLTATGATFDSADITYTNGGGGELRYNIDDGDDQEMALNADGDLTIDGGLVTGTAGSCTAATPCDAVFDPEVYTVPSIEDHAAAMWQNRYLPAVGPTRAGEPVHMTTKMLAMLNELEHAHIYIEQLNAEIKQIRADHAAQIGLLNARLDALRTE